MTSLTFAAVVMTLSGVPRPSQIRWCLLPVFRRSTGDGPVSAPPLPFSRGCGTHPRRPWTSRAGRPRSAQQAGPGAVGRRRPPVATVEPSPAGLPGAESQLRRQELPGDVVVEDVQDALQTQPVRQRPRPRRLLRPSRQQRLDQCPQVIIHDPRPSTHTLPNGRIVTPVTAYQDISPRSCYELYGYRPRRSALDAVAACRERCWRTPRPPNRDSRSIDKLQDRYDNSY